MKGILINEITGDLTVECRSIKIGNTEPQIAEAIGNIGGDKLILKGCEKPRLPLNAKSRGEGLVFLRTKDNPDGEVLRWVGGDTSAGMHVVIEHIPIEAQGYRYEKAYTVRRLEPGAGDEWYNWDDFIDVITARQISERFAGVNADIGKLREEIVSEPAGCVKLWAGKEAPEGYLICDGRSIKKENFKSLYDAIGDSYNKCKSAGETDYETPDGYFRVPDLRGRFVVGTWEEDPEYNSNGRTGGEKKHTLSDSELPTHKHSVNDYYYAENAAMTPATDATTLDKSITGGYRSDDDNTYLHYYKHDTASVGHGNPHENSPPYYSLMYIIKY